MQVNIYDANNVMLRDLDKVGFERIGLRKRYEMMQDGNVHIWVWDGANHNQRRRDIYPKYKMQRPPMAEDRFAQIRLFREALRHSVATQVCCRGWEADDVAGQLAVDFAKRGVSVVMHSNDLDWYQLCVHPAITIDGIRKLPDVAPRHIPIYKALVGDKSDNIDGVPGFGPQAWAALAPVHRDLLTAIVDGNEPHERVMELPLKTRPRNLLLDPANIEVARQCVSITRFLSVPSAELDAGIMRGTLNRAAADELFRRFFL